MATTAIHAVEEETGLRVEKAGVFCGAEVTGVDLKKPLTDAQADAILALHAEHGVLAFPDQHLEADQLVAFGRGWASSPSIRSRPTPPSGRS